MASLRTTPNGTYQVHYRDPVGRRRPRTFKRKTDANRFRSVVEADKLRGDWLDPQLARPTVAEWAKRWSETMTQAPKTRETYGGHRSTPRTPAPPDSYKTGPMSGGQIRVDRFRGVRPRASIPLGPTHRSVT